MEKSIWVALLFLGYMSIPLYAAVADPDANNVVIVLDASGSMNEKMSGSPLNKMDAAKRALIKVLKKVPPGTNVGLLVFSSGNLKNDWAYPLGPLDSTRLEAAIRLPLPSGSTPLGAYIQKGADRLLEQRARQFGYGTYRLLIVTDGEAQDRSLVDRYTPEVMARGITMDVIGVDMRKAHTLATKVHSYRSADDPASLDRALSDVFAEIGGTDQTHTDEDAFEQIAPIPDEMAQAMLKALAVSGNQPIGSGNFQAKMEKPFREASKRSMPPAGPPPAPRSVSEDGTFWYWGILIAVIIVMLMRGKRRRKGDNRL